MLVHRADIKPQNIPVLVRRLQRRNDVLERVLPRVGDELVRLGVQLQEVHVGVDPYSTQVFAEKVMFLMENKAKRESLAINGLISVKSFAKENVVLKWEQLINNI